MRWPWVKRSLLEGAEAVVSDLGAALDSWIERHGDVVSLLENAQARDRENRKLIESQRGVIDCNIEELEHLVEGLAPVYVAVQSPYDVGVPPIGSDDVPVKLRLALGTRFSPELIRSPGFSAIAHYLFSDAIDGMARRAKTDWPSLHKQLKASLEDV